MPTSSQAFDSHLETWKREQAMPWQRVRRKVEISNLLRHVGQSDLRILDAGGGNGYASIPFAQIGTRGSPLADLARTWLISERYEKLGLQEMDFREAFDGVICVDAMEHVCPEDWPGVLRGFREALKPGGVLHFTPDLAEADEVEEAYEQVKALGLPVVPGELADMVVLVVQLALVSIREKRPKQ